MPTLDLYFLHDTHGTKQLLTVLQKSTRLLQSLCNMLKKDQKHMSCIRLVPALKRTLEMVDVNNCPANVFCIGQLKAKDLKGNEISDITYRQDVDDEDSQFTCAMMCVCLTNGCNILDDTSSMLDDDSRDLRPDQDDDDDDDNDDDNDEGDDDDDDD
jgi:hypothetical protein